MVHGICLSTPWDWHRTAAPFTPFQPPPSVRNMAVLWSVWDLSTDPKAGSIRQER